MPNWCDCTYKCVGDLKDVRSLYKALKYIDKRKTSIIKNGFGKWWLGNLVVKLGGNWEKYRCRGEITYSSNPQPIGFSGILLAKRQNSFYCTYFLHNRNVADTKSPYPIKRLEVIRWFNQKSMVFNQSLS